MTQAIWLLVVWIAGTAAILGSLMLLGSLLLCLLPPPTSTKKLEKQQSSTLNRWNHLKLIGFALAIAIAGLTILVLLPFPAP